jgi:hypothetical protein
MESRKKGIFLYSWLPTGTYQKNLPIPEKIPARGELGFFSP